MFSKIFVMLMILYYLSPHLFVLADSFVGGFSPQFTLFAEEVHDVVGWIGIIYMVIKIYQADHTSTKHECDSDT